MPDLARAAACFTQPPYYGFYYFPFPTRSAPSGGAATSAPTNSTAFGHRVDFLPLTGHLQLIDEDYAAQQPFKIGTVREGIRWAMIEKTPYHYDFSTVQMMLDAGQRHGIQQIWDLCHFGYPDDLTPLHPMFARRFAALCRAFVDFYRSSGPMMCSSSRPSTKSASSAGWGARPTALRPTATARAGG